MLLPHPSPMERHILDLLDRIERGQAERIGALENRIAALETRNRELMQRNSDLAARVAAQEDGIAALSASLASWLAPPDWQSG